MDERDDLRLKCVLHFCKFRANPTSTSTLTMSSESQWNADSNDILSVRKYYQIFTYESNIFLCEKYAILQIQTNGGANAKESPKQSLPLRSRKPPSNIPIPRPTPLTIPNGIRIQSAVLPQYTFRRDTQTDRHTQTDRWARRQVSKISDNYARYADRERRANNRSSKRFYQSTMLTLCTFYTCVGSPTRWHCPRHPPKLSYTVNSDWISSIC